MEVDESCSPVRDSERRCVWVTIHLSTAHSAAKSSLSGHIGTNKTLEENDDANFLTDNRHLTVYNPFCFTFLDYLSH